MPFIPKDDLLKKDLEFYALEEWHKNTLPLNYWRKLAALPMEEWPVEALRTLVPAPAKALPEKSDDEPFPLDPAIQEYMDGLTRNRQRS